MYAAFVSILYLRMKYAERMLSDYYDARSCQSIVNCREIVSAEILDYRSKQISFTYHGSRGSPLRKGKFEEYLFTLSMGEAETKTVKVLPGIPSDASRFDVSNSYIPSGSVKTMANAHLFDGKVVSAEIWKERVTALFISVPAADQEGVITAEQTLSIGPMPETHEIVLVTNNHPAFSAEGSRADFTGWTSGLILIGLPFLIFGLDWLFGKGRALKEKIK